uniref:Uncharacterized protein n=2 Tax=Corethron hystrix TaxID=216773 RepID=A0A7S1BZS2_9STRA|mmetsp:Transcript_5798/g.12276  ORF Transcript_5798/g.12276 Transcript_5798/m.12276 type:complete len:771 (+) Transcript_5798:403-2715(+)|eukprot:CAMPEP_0113306292 /NCGR_PEP_ID=MMETSP0010_2-20120614/5599_1 /TAXON_ID=216773 ORGANISM="Corethron hystrix, Strain 308" /NCGR_SAMPLE_ID=MMETSP0010_2 /ASSEMBLY_ACC=CAM_ASM_000155 /LENGTH=770 /DNA_ID=CAMNT_0000160925 /DNA_START=278 /DNA_END=2590 /DNA_ORIENTATION=- /assembly_acc=CAM_ASM_000155
MPPPARKTSQSLELGRLTSSAIASTDYNGPISRPSAKSRSALRAAAVLRLAYAAGPSTADDEDGGTHFPIETIEFASPSPISPLIEPTATLGLRYRRQSSSFSRSAGRRNRAGTPEGLRTRLPDLRALLLPDPKNICRSSSSSIVLPDVHIKRRQPVATFDDFNRKFIGNFWYDHDVPDALGRRPRNSTAMRRSGSMRGLSLRGSVSSLSSPSQHHDYQRAFVLDSGLLRRRRLFQRQAHEDALLKLIGRLRDDPNAGLVVHMVLEAVPASDSEDDWDDTTIALRTDAPNRQKPVDRGGILTTTGWGTVDRRLILSSLQTLADESVEFIGGDFLLSQVRDGMAAADYEYSDDEGVTKESRVGNKESSGDVQWQKDLYKAFSFASAAVRNAPTTGEREHFLSPSREKAMLSPSTGSRTGSNHVSPMTKKKLKGRLDRVAKNMNCSPTEKVQEKLEKNALGKKKKINGNSWLKKVVMGGKDADKSRKSTASVSSRRSMRSQSASLSKTLHTITKNFRTLSESICILLDLEENTPEESADAVRALRRAYVALSKVPTRELRLMQSALSSERGVYNLEGDEPDTDDEFEIEPDAVCDGRVEHADNNDEELDWEVILRRKKIAMKHDSEYEKWTINYTNMMTEFQDNINRITPKKSTPASELAANDFSAESRRSSGSLMQGFQSNDSPAMIRAAFNNADIWEPSTVDSILSSVGKGALDRPNDYYGVRTGTDMNDELDAEADIGNGAWESSEGDGNNLRRKLVRSKQVADDAVKR